MCPSYWKPLKTTFICSNLLLAVRVGSKFFFNVNKLLDSNNLRIASQSKRTSNFDIILLLKFASFKTSRETLSIIILHKKNNSWLIHTKSIHQQLTNSFNSNLKSHDLSHDQNYMLRGSKVSANFRGRNQILKSKSQMNKRGSKLTNWFILFRQLIVFSCYLN